MAFVKKSLQISKKRGTKNLIICGTGLYQNNHFIRTIQNRCVIQLYYENLKLSVQSEKSPFRQFDFLVNLIFRPENALAERAVQNNQSIRTNKTGR